MDIVVATTRKPVSERKKALVAEKISRLGRLRPSLERAEVHVSEERNPRIAERARCEVVLRGAGRVFRARAGAGDVLAAVDVAVDKLEHQVERAKRHGERAPAGRRAPSARRAPRASRGLRVPRLRAG
ncbi:MAG: ribosome hibernation-promoting factor, HPF/YfiA family [Acidimicrobiales bacterium]